MTVATQRIFKSVGNAEVKVVSQDEGLMLCYPSVPGVLDSQNDIIDAGAYAPSINAKRQVALCFSHDWSRIIGRVLSMRELPAGSAELPENLKAYGALECQVQFALATQDGRESFELVKGGFVREMSIGFEIPRGGDYFKDGVRHITAIDLYEASLVLAGANPATHIGELKSAATTEKGTAALAEGRVAAKVAERKAAALEALETKDGTIADELAERDLQEDVNSLLSAFFDATCEALYGWADGKEPSLDERRASLSALVEELRALMSQVLAGAEPEDLTKAAILKAGAVLNRANKAYLDAIHDSAVAMSKNADHELSGHEANSGSSDEASKSITGTSNEGDEAAAKSQLATAEAEGDLGTAAVVVSDESAAIELSERVAVLTKQLGDVVTNHEAVLKRLGLEV